jgi:hypothetical protein
MLIFAQGFLGINYWNNKIPYDDNLKIDCWEVLKLYQNSVGRESDVNTQ